MPDKTDTAKLTILALDTCTESCSVALTHNGQVYAEQADAPREHSQRLLPMVQNVLSAANISLKDVALIAYGRGPGSFTGIRICTSMTQGLALGQDLPVVGISTLQAMAQEAMDKHGSTQVVAAIDARMGEVYWGEFKLVEGIATLVGNEQVCAPEDVSRALDYQQTVTACGTGFDTYPALVIDNMRLLSDVKFPQAEAMLVLASHAHANGESTDVEGLTPVYLRDTVTWKKLPGRE
ncbi:tRNA (adenosine(37)-N6)-threonylcarbamoyltransferase complex dimerization subunit type 1 TsaB [Shewanella sp. Isolate11]|uniref:tRNA (adenosine(37)-N6)-threonylcarbamoyltransferase complex dimerization subunit type 1 TsaB n=1 Tax=Shewanella sp. Isolate11 TaxID=2908530 RepID=UPI001EFCB8FF|nr:tRNA (adenosine(37)-N6)-threonylcarbamoyltransferase complex dimerization subunit type 1 TsaB [Shewanella sp. Isolate11]MCG9696838.1 tRNA (adenosine(37)-N6)-threonylcarbamoyltransferase complex dimerization subunit type 1 TsaB [Shewanella sp. Isolate11]